MKEIKQNLVEEFMVIDGEVIKTDEKVKVYNPANLKEQIGEINVGNVKEVKLSVDAAERSWIKWSKTSAEERASYLIRIADYIEKNYKSLAHLLVRENGKIMKEAEGDILGAVGVFRYYATLVDELKDRVVENHQGTMILKRQPIGVVSIIVPWNFPIILTALMLAPSLLAGNTAVIKPPTYVPLTLTKILRECAAILPKGVINIVLGSGSTVGTEMVEHPKVRKVAFTGSTETGRTIMRAAAQTIKKVSLELGGNDAAIILADAKIDDHLIDEFIQGSLTASGQICYSMKRIFVHQSHYDEFVNKFTKAASEIVVGPALNSETTMGPINNKAQFNIIHDLIEKAKKSGATIATVGKLASNTTLEDGYFIFPTIITNINHYEEIVQKEQFGPVIPILPFQNEEEVIELINDSEFGLANSIWTTDVDYGFKLGSKLQSGSVFVNTHRVGSSAVNMPFGGFKQSGVGRGHGVEALHEHSELQALIHRIDM